MYATGSKNSSQGLAKLTFNVQTPQQVPEPTANKSLIVMGLMGASLVISRRYKKVISKSIL